MTARLAQINIAKLRHPIDAPETAGFVKALDAVNGIAERSPGFIWRATGEDADSRYASEKALFGNDPLILPNLSVWASVQALYDFAFKTLHKRFYARRAEWFQPIADQVLAMWWIGEGDAMPTMREAERRLAHLNANGPSETAFSFDHIQTADIPSGGFSAVTSTTRTLSLTPPARHSETYHG